MELYAVLDTVLRGLRPRFEDSEIAVDVVRECPSAVVHGDPARLRIVFSNVLTNALKYTPRGGRVTVRVASRPGTVQIAVTDTGPGIPAAFRERVFEKFFRVEHHSPSSTQGTHGAGIGLYLCRQILEAHGGTIHAEADADGHGTRIAMEWAAQT